MFQSTTTAAARLGDLELRLRPCLPRRKKQPAAAAQKVPHLLLRPVVAAVEHPDVALRVGPLVDVITAKSPMVDVAAAAVRTMITRAGAAVVEDIIIITTTTIIITITKDAEEVIKRRAEVNSAELGLPRGKKLSSLIRADPEIPTRNVPSNVVPWRHFCRVA